MIVREQGEHFVLFKQYDHSKVSGFFASHWRDRPVPYQSVLYAIENHDIGWKQLDSTIAWDDETNQPYSFTNYPLKEKLAAYTYGINLVEKEDTYAGYLCSRHLAFFVRNAKDKESMTFFESEMQRQQRLKQSFTKDELEQLDFNYNLLKICDNLSLFICLNEPGENTHQWFRNGFTWNGETITPICDNRSTLKLSPNPFSKPFNISIPYQVVSRKRHVLQEDLLTIRVEC